MIAPPGTRPAIVICRPGFEPALAEEIRLRFQRRPESREHAMTAGIRTGAGLVRIEERAAETLAAHFPAPFIFERQRLENAILIETQSLKTAAHAIAVKLLPAITNCNAAWTIQAFAANPDADRPLTKRAQNLKEVFGEFCARRFTVAFRRFQPVEDLQQPCGCMVLQIALTPAGAWCAVTPAHRRLTPWAGGIYRMRFDPAAPSRSYLKIEEVFARMGTEPCPAERVIDLGAAPGGWSYAFLKRGCRIIAVDHGPLRIKALGGGQIVHRRENGITFRPPAEWLPVDWMASDMLIPPGQALGMLRKWLDLGWTRRFVVNLKLPQANPYPVLQPIEDYLSRLRGIRFQIRQLYHDRREVTLYGERTDALAPARPSRLFGATAPGAGL